MTGLRVCDGGLAGGCSRAAQWSVCRAGEAHEAGARFACGRHLTIAVDEITGGECCRLDLRRIVCLER
ncbi:hypothetical protein B4N89_27635 [Embleya scabrispora]|uniref:Uncharacterized protein n=1 Tax=Embleya scabrispora TaxID=159449 RepID=A0A1T3P527_9ACTN|nr:hypothetical protein [Embleya scabrispora]OPC84197.1 hypothetical protein B4N89_27635 [Embleya scabrispora]